MKNGKEIYASFTATSQMARTAATLCDKGLVRWKKHYICAIRCFETDSDLIHITFQPVHSEGDQPWDFFGGNDAKTETPVLWPPHAKS